jgi:hypothetical protein
MLLLSCKECGANYFSAASRGQCPDCGADLAADSPAGGRDYGRPDISTGGNGVEFGRLWLAALGHTSARPDEA